MAGEIREALQKANDGTRRQPTLIIGHTVMGLGARREDGSSYEVEIRAIEKGSDDGSVPINRF